MQINDSAFTRRSRLLARASLLLAILMAVLVVLNITIDFVGGRGWTYVTLAVTAGCVYLYFDVQRLARRVEAHRSADSSS